MSRVRVEGLEKRFAGANGTIAVLRGFALDVADGSFVAILGPSGCGKTTLLRTIAGLERADAGTIRFDERDVTRVPAERRGVGMVFATDALFPHLSALANVAYGLHGRGLAASDIATRARDAARRMRVPGDLLDRPARSLSGGERQRVAIARALAPRPSIVLLDEPLSRLDVPLRAALRIEIGRALREAGATTLFVTHDQSEAMALADRIAVLRDGRIEQIAKPRDLYDAPVTRYVAAFVGSPAMSFVSADAFGDPPSLVESYGFRAGDVRVTASGGVAGVVRTIEDLGAVTYAHVDTPLGSVVANVGVAGEAVPAVGERVRLELDRSRAHPFDARGMRVVEYARV
jgi:multiple sugar transport system ATP-binding protein